MTLRGKSDSRHPLAVACPECQAIAGEPCVSNLAGWTHLARVATAALGWTPAPIDGLDR